MSSAAAGPVRKVQRRARRCSTTGALIPDFDNCARTCSPRSAGMVTARYSEPARTVMFGQRRATRVHGLGGIGPSGIRRGAWCVLGQQSGHVVPPVVWSV
ncbi:Uncharacterised protein [Mycobacteroides abscessus subsp. abscessus]|nr:Uncharacterised protein [Mycobacteroides abscessus subsp. abscessus]